MTDSDPDGSPRDESGSGPTDEDFAALVDDLSDTLRDLRRELGEREPGDGGADRDAERSGRRRSTRRTGRFPPRPPGLGELVRFTNDYTIPSLIATLEATIELLELFRRFLQLAGPRDLDSGRVTDPGGGRGRGPGSLLSSGVSSAGERAAADVTDALGRLRTALDEADLPEDEESRDVVERARDLSAEIERRVAESRDAVASQRDRERRTNRGDDAVTIDVTDEDGDGDGDSADTGSTDDGRVSGNGDGAGDDDADRGDDESPQVDVDAELESIKRTLGKAEGRDVDGDGESGGDEPPADDSSADESGPRED
ncbi:DUF7547 family protein [Halobaculum sp. D14]|uniref:DUF7547 family protein n=1 Tax=Halobaculum sp. D14 TaxID=3421642 RepID=UPI003EB7CC3F